MIKYAVFAAIIIAAWYGIAKAQPAAAPDFNYTPETLKALGPKSRTAIEQKLTGIAALKPSARTVANTLLAYEKALSDFNEMLAYPVFLAYVSPSEPIRVAAAALESETGKYAVELDTRSDIFEAMKELAAQNPALDAQQKRLLDRILLNFRRNGLDLPKDKIEEFKKLRRQVVDLELKFTKNVRDYKDSITVSTDELKGLSPDYISNLKHDVDGNYTVTLDYPDYYPFMTNADDERSRKELEFKFSNRCKTTNVPIMEKVFALRNQIAVMLGYKNHAEYVLADRMAKTPEQVTAFLQELKTRLAPKNEAEIAQRLVMKRADDAEAQEFHEWDWRYWNNKYRKEKLSLDQEKIKEYFPLKTVITGMIATFEKVFGVEFKKSNIPVWHPDVSAYEIKDKATGETIAYFYMDLFPREGKYKHAACFGLTKGRETTQGYRKPSAAIVANFSKPSEKYPSLLKHDEVVTLFHEFGHVTHNIFTKARFAAFSGTSVLRDFVEVPSKMLEYWAWDPQVLKAISGNYKNPQEKLPDDIIAKMIEARNCDTGLIYTRQLFFGILDMTYHTTLLPDTTALYSKLMYDVRRIPMTKGTAPQAGFTHLLDGYDAGYYGYLWSEVLAADIFSVFEKQGVLNPETGHLYREKILAPGGTFDENSIVANFLGRPVSQSAFIKSIGLN